MNENIRYCVRGCSRPRYHLRDCEDSTTCHGCEPRRADHGLLCWPCHRRLELMLSQAEITDRWLTGNLSPNTTARTKDDAEARGSRKDPPAPLDVAILDQRDLLRDRLACWADDFAAHSGTKGPLRHGVVEDSGYLVRWLSNIEWLDWIGDWFEELAETLSDAHSLAPWRPAFTRLPAIPCPDCHGYSLGLFGGEEDVSCTNRQCRAMFTPSRYGIWEQMISAKRATA